MVEAMTSREKSQAAKRMQQRDDVVTILHPRTTNFNTDPPSEQLARPEASAELSGGKDAVFFSLEQIDPHSVWIGCLQQRGLARLPRAPQEKRLRPSCW